MTKHDTKAFDAAQIQTIASLGGPVIGRIAHGGEAGEVLVEVAGATPRAARLLTTMDRAELLKPHNYGREVLVLFQDGDRGKPIIVGLMEDRLDSVVENTPELQSEKKEVVVDGKRVVIEAQEEIELKCGQGSITIRKDGKIVVKGTNLLSRSSGPNRIKGGSINLN